MRRGHDPGPSSILTNSILVYLVQCSSRPNRLMQAHCVALQRFLNSVKRENIAVMWSVRPMLVVQASVTWIQGWWWIQNIRILRAFSVAHIRVKQSLAPLRHRVVPRADWSTRRMKADPRKSLAKCIKFKCSKFYASIRHTTFPLHKCLLLTPC